MLQSVRMTTHLYVPGGGTVMQQTDYSHCWDVVDRCRPGLSMMIQSLPYSQDLTKLQYEQ